MAHKEHAHETFAQIHLLYMGHNPSVLSKLMLVINDRTKRPPHVPFGGDTV